MTKFTHFDNLRLNQFGVDPIFSMWHDAIIVAVTAWGDIQNWLRDQMKMLYPHALGIFPAVAANSFDDNEFGQKSARCQLAYPSMNRIVKPLAIGDVKIQARPGAIGLTDVSDYIISWVTQAINEGCLFLHDCHYTSSSRHLSNRKNCDIMNPRAPESAKGIAGERQETATSDD
jgi:hypothetical protein